MIKQAKKLTFILFLSIMIFACSKGKKLEMEMNATLDGKPAVKATILIDGVEEGATDDEGHFFKVIEKMPGTEIQVSAIKEAPGHRIKPWKKSFVMKIPQKGTVDKYSFQVEFETTKYFTLAVTEKGSPLGGATININNKKVGKTDEKGEFVYDYKIMPKKGFKCKVIKKGYASWRKTTKVAPGQRLEASLFREAIISIAALTDEYGLEKGIPDVGVSINKRVGKTNADGVYTYVYRGRPGRKVKLTLTAPGYIPSKWEKEIVLEGKKIVQRFFYPTKPKPIRVGIYGYVNNTPGEDFTDILHRIEEAVSNNLFSYFSFHEVQTATLHERMKQAKLDSVSILTEGWQETPLIRIVDMILFGSVSREEDQFTIESKVYTSSGKVILSQINTAKTEKEIKKIAKKIVRDIIDRFPFEGTILSMSEDQRYAINLGKDDYKIGRGTEFALMAPTMDTSGRIKSYRNIGTLKVRNVKKIQSWAEIDNLAKDESINIGDKVVRRLYREEEIKYAQNTLIISAKGGLPPDVAPLPGVNIYLGDRWVGTTGSEGKAQIPIRLSKTYDIVLYRHGYHRLSEEVKADRDKDVKEFNLTVNNALFKVESLPSKAEVFVDQDNIGKTPILEGELVNFGFHTVRLSVSGDYRDWEEVIEFDKKVVDCTGKNKIAFFKDYLKIGKRAEEKRDIAEAINAYRSTETEHPDYSIVHCRLARLYMDEKSDYDSAIQEFQNVLSRPENQQLINKQFAVTHTNLGHAYYEKGDKLVQTDRTAAAQSFAKAITYLKTAKQNTRFFPNLHYDEAVHDTYYYLAISYNKLYLATRKRSLLDTADLAWREYFDFFPKNLEKIKTFAQMRESAERYWDQIKDLI